MNKKQKEKLKLIIISFCLFVLGLLFEKVIVNKFVSALLYIVAYLIVGGPVLKKAFLNLSNKRFLDENFLMTFASLGAMALLEYEEACAVMLFYAVGELFESIASAKSRNSIKDLMELTDDTATVLRDGEFVTLDCGEINAGDTIKLSAGEKVPVDGVILKGEGYFDTSAITGESVPVMKRENDEVMSGFINKEGGILLTAQKRFEDSAVSKILEMVENASAKKSKQENFITKFSGYYTPSVVGLAVLIAVIVPIFTGFNFALWIKRALTFLVVSCPCAWVISVPLSFFGGRGSCAKSGILVKGGNYIESLSKADTICFDKTGTLTKGSFEVTEINSENEEELLKLTAYAQYFSTHPIGKAIIKKFGNTIDENEISDYKEIAGKGISARVFGKEIFAGNEKLMDFAGVTAEPVSGTVCHVCADKKYLGYIKISDAVKPEAKEMTEKLKKLGIKETIMLTGDNKESAEAVKDEIGISKVYASLLPQDKTKKVEELKNSGRKVMYVGDGINDAPVLMLSDCGISMGKLGSDAAIEASDAVIIDDNILKIPKMIEISRKTVRIANENVWFALIVKFAVLALSAAGLVGMNAAVFADVGVSIIAILNSFRTMANSKQL